MGTTVKFICFLVTIFLIGCKVFRPEYLKFKGENGEKLYYNRTGFLKEYAICSCIEQSMHADSAKWNDKSRAVMYDLSDGDLIKENAGKKIDSLTAIFVQKMKEQKGETYEGRRAPVYDCINYSKSKELAELIRELLIKLRKE